MATSHTAPAAATLGRRSFSRWLLLRHPLVWRSSLLPLAAVCIPLSSLAWYWGMENIMTPVDVWSAGQIDAAVTLADSVSAGLAGLWIWSQMRFPVGEVGIRKLATITLLTVTGLAMLLTPGLLLRGTLGWQVAQAMPANEFQSHWALHEKHGFWCCSASFTPADVERLRPDLAMSFARFGLHSEFTVTDVTGRGGSLVCPGPVHQCLAFHEAGSLAPLEFADRLRNIANMQAVGADGPWAIVRANGLRERSLAAIGGALVASLLLVPWHVWARHLLWSDALTGRRHADLRLWRPHWLQRFDSALLRRRPMLWATRVHVFLFHSLTIGLMLCGILLVVALYFATELVSALDKWGDRVGWSTTIPSIIAVLSLGGTIWWLGRRHWRVPAVTASEQRRLVLWFTLASLALPSLIFMMLIPSLMDSFQGEDATIFSLLGVLLVGMSVMHILAVSLLDNIGGKAWLFVLLGIALTYTPMAVETALGINGTLILPGLIVGGYLGTYILVVFCRGAIATDRTLPWLCAFLVGGAPAFALYVIILLARVVGQDRYHAVFVAFIIFVLVPSWILITPLRVLGELRFAPRVD